jgi:hypothetical protein
MNLDRPTTHAANASNLAALRLGNHLAGGRHAQASQIAEDALFIARIMSCQRRPEGPRRR